MRRRPAARRFAAAIGLLGGALALAGCGGGGGGDVSPPTMDMSTLSVPQADAGADQEVDRSAPVTLDGRASGGTPGDSMTYTWTQVDGPSVTPTPVATLSGMTPSFLAPDTVTTLSFDLVVSGSAGSSRPDRVYIYVMENTGAALFVDGDAGSDVHGTGARDKPYATITRALTQVANREDIYVRTRAGGLAYVGALTLASGTSLYGGFGEHWVRDVTTARTKVTAGAVAVGLAVAEEAWVSGFELTATGSADAATSVFGIRAHGNPLSSYARLHLEDNTITAGDVGPGMQAAEPGTSYGVYARDLVNLEVARNWIRAGDGGRGGDGAPGGSGGPGGSGAAGINATAAPFYGMPSPGNGGLGGDNPAVAGVQGGNGGRGGFLEPAPFGGSAGNGSQVNCGGSGGDAGPAGTSGGTGARGADGATQGPNAVDAGLGLGLLQNDLLRSAAGTPGGDGDAGCGGGGGGGGGGISSGGAGGGGGGGGAGGAGGTGGGAGGGGGASIGLFLLRVANAVVAGNTINAGHGGDAGAGGDGGIGGSGGAGGFGGGGEGGGGAGGDGGEGGNGRAGGDGSGGGGGPSYGLYAGAGVSGAPGAVNSNTIGAGDGGAGGDSRHGAGGEGGWSFGSAFNTGDGDAQLLGPDNILINGAGGLGGNGATGPAVPGNSGQSIELLN